MNKSHRKIQRRNSHVRLAGFLVVSGLVNTWWVLETVVTMLKFTQQKEVSSLGWHLAKFTPKLYTQTGMVGVGMLMGIFLFQIMLGGYILRKTQSKLKLSPGTRRFAWIMALFSGFFMFKIMGMVMLRNLEQF